MAAGKITVRNRSGLHLRPAAELTKICAPLDSKITIVAGEKKVDPKSVLMLMSAGIGKGTEIEVITEGPNADAHLQIILSAIEGGLGEGEE